jgi:hypothetical protein
MRLSWLSATAFLSMFAGRWRPSRLLLLFRPTITAGLLLAMGAFLNVAMINLSYDVPVKIFALHLLFSCVFCSRSIPGDWSTFCSGTAPPQPPTHGSRGSTGPGSGGPRSDSSCSSSTSFWSSTFRKLGVYKTTKTLVTGPFRPAVYEVRSFVVGGDTIPGLGADTLRWNDVIFDNGNAGSVNTRDQMFCSVPPGYFRCRDTHTHAGRVADLLCAA